MDQQEDQQEAPPSHPAKPTWPETFFGMMDEISRRSDDARTKLGAIITDQKNRIVSVGYNGLPRGVLYRPERVSGPGKYPWMVHAELNAILNSMGKSLEGCTLYIPIMPCSTCAGAICQVGIKRVILHRQKSEDYEKAPGHHMQSRDVVLTMFQEAGVSLEYYG